LTSSLAKRPENHTWVSFYNDSLRRRAELSISSRGWSVASFGKSCQSGLAVFDLKMQKSGAIRNSSHNLTPIGDHRLLRTILAIPCFPFAKSAANL
jgi:hypothetical protein